jgi:hypothetical protein
MIVSLRRDGGQRESTMYEMCRLEYATDLDDYATTEILG